MLVRYAHARNRDQWQWLDEVFAPDAVVDARDSPGATGGDVVPAARWPEALRAQRGAGFLFERLHLSDSLVLSAGDTPRTITGTKFERYNEAAGATTTCTRVYGFDLDRFVRTEHGWRIGEKRIVRRYEDTVACTPPEQQSGESDPDDVLIARSSRQVGESPDRDGDVALSYRDASTREALDRAQITEHIDAYGQAVDLSRWELFDSIFDPAAVMDLSGVGLSPSSSPAAFATGSEQRHGADWTGVQHCMTDVLVDVDGDTATSFTDCDLSRLTATAGPSALATERTSCVFYVDRWVRTAENWAMDKREVYLRGRYVRPVSLAHADVFVRARDAIHRLPQLRGSGEIP